MVLFLLTLFWRGAFLLETINIGYRHGFYTAFTIIAEKKVSEQ
jgi:hypothetical protein